MVRRGLWAHAGFVLLAGPLVVACAFGASWRYGAVTAANLVALAAVGSQLRRRSGVDRAGWSLMVVGTAVLLMHNVQNQVALAGAGRPASGAIADATMALGYTLLLAGGALATTRFARSDHGGMLDAAVTGLAAASLLWGVVLHPAHVHRGSSPATTAYEMSLVLLVTALAGVIVRMAVVAREVRTASLYLLLAIVATTAADVAFTFTEDPVSRLATWWASALCVLALAAFAAAVVHPSISDTRPDGATAAPERSPGGLTRWRLAFLGVALAANPALAAGQQLFGGSPDLALLSTGSLVMVPLVVSRIAQLAHRQAEAERRLRDLAAHDDLTGLPNRRAMVQRLEELLERSADGCSPGVVVLYIDLDDFKAINDTHGHGVGDELLRTVAARIQGAVRPGDLVARFGGDEFVVVLESDAPAGDDVAVAIEAALAAPVTIGTVVASGHASVGITAAAPGVRVDAETLLGRADAQMYCAKRSRPEHADTRGAPADVRQPSHVAS